jgi:hypothetical protein
MTVSLIAMPSPKPNSHCIQRRPFMKKFSLESSVCQILAPCALGRCCAANKSKCLLWIRKRWHYQVYDGTKEVSVPMAGDTREWRPSGKRAPSVSLTNARNIELQVCLASSLRTRVCILARPKLHHMSGSFPYILTF